LTFQKKISVLWKNSFKPLSMMITTVWYSYAMPLALPTGFCLLEKRFVDVTLRYGVHPATIDRMEENA